MGSWFVGAKSGSVLDDAGRVMKSNPAECDDGAKDIWVAFLKRGGRWNDEFLEAQATEYVFFDGGGSIRVDEPKVGWEANGCPMKTYVRHLPFTIEVFQDLKPAPDLHGVVGFGGFHRKYILTPKTVDEAIPIMERLLKGTESLRQELEVDIQRDFNQALHAASLRKCGCLSGLMYADCCGKYIESQGHRELRRTIAAEKESGEGEE